MISMQLYQSAKIVKNAAISIETDGLELAKPQTGERSN